VGGLALSVDPSRKYEVSKVTRVEFRLKMNGKRVPDHKAQKKKTIKRGVVRGRRDPVHWWKKGMGMTIMNFGDLGGEASSEKLRGEGGKRYRVGLGCMGGPKGRSEGDSSFGTTGGVK